MKKYFILTTLLLASVTAGAQQIDGRVTIDNVRIERTGDNLQVEYRVTVPKRAVKRGYTMLFSPVIGVEGGEWRQSLPAVAVRGRGTRFAAERGEWVEGPIADNQNVTWLSNGQTATLTATVPFQAWMYDARLSIDAAEGGCCTVVELADLVVDAKMPVRPAPEPQPVVAVVPEPAGWVPVTVADSLSTAFPFVRPASEYEGRDPSEIYDDERENALVVYYHTGRHDLDRTYMDNDHTLATLANVVRMIMESGDSRVDRVVVAGFASPEGGFALNDRLAFDRAVTIKRYLMDATGLADSSVELYNGSEDWRGLRAMVAASDLPERQQVLDLIDDTPVWDSRTRTGRQSELMRLNGGTTYRHLMREYFPYLRTGAFIRVYYNNNLEIHFY